MIVKQMEIKPKPFVDNFIAKNEDGGQTQKMESLLRGIISGCGSATGRLAGNVDFILQPGMLIKCSQRFSSYITDH